MRVACERYAKSVYSKRIMTALLCYKNRSLACRVSSCSQLISACQDSVLTLPDRL